MKLLVTATDEMITDYSSEREKSVWLKLFTNVLVPDIPPQNSTNACLDESHLIANPAPFLDPKPILSVPSVRVIEQYRIDNYEESDSEAEAVTHESLSIIPWKIAARFEVFATFLIENGGFSSWDAFCKKFAMSPDCNHIALNLEISSLEKKHFTTYAVDYRRIRFVSPIGALLGAKPNEVCFFVAFFSNSPIPPLM